MHVVRRTSGRGSSRTLRAGSNGAAPPKPQRPAPATREQPLTHGLEVFVGVVVAAALVKEIFRRMGDNPVSATVRGVSRDDTALSIAVAVRMLDRMGASVLRRRAR